MIGLVAKRAKTLGAALALALLLVPWTANATPTGFFKLVNDGVFTIEGGTYDGRTAISLGFRRVRVGSTIPELDDLRGFFRRGGDQIETFVFGSDALGDFGAEILASDFGLRFDTGGRIRHAILGIVDPSYSGRIVAREPFARGRDRFSLKRAGSRKFVLPARTFVLPEPVQRQLPTSGAPVAEVSEPGTLVLMSLALVGLWAAGRRRA